jgi:hypothetical protein
MNQYIARGKNVAALTRSFGFFYGISMSLANLLERSELFTVSADIREQLVLALSGLVTLVATLTMEFEKALDSASTGGSVSVNIYRTISAEIRSFHARCETISESMWRHRLSVSSMSTEAGNNY